MSVQIDPRASVHPKAQFGENVTVGPFAVIEESVIVGDGTTIGSCVLLGRGARLGKDCRVHHGAVIGHVPQDLKYTDEPTTCELGDRNTVREYAVLHRGTGEAGRTIIGSDNLFMAFSHVAHDCEVGSRVIMANSATLAGHVTVEDYVIIGGLTPVHQFVKLGCHSMVGGGIRAGKDVPPYVLAGGEPIAFEGLNAIGLRRRGFTRETIDAIDRAYNFIYHTGLNVSQGVAKIKADPALIGVAEVRTIVEFIAGCKRGIIPGPRHRHL